MLLYHGKEYYPLELTAVKSKDKKTVYEKAARNKPYVYLALENTENEGDR